MRDTQKVATYRHWFSGAEIICRPSANLNCRDQVEALTKKMGRFGLDRQSKYHTEVGEQRLSFRWLTASSPQKIEGPYATLIDRVIKSLGLQELHGHGHGSRVGDYFETFYGGDDVPVLSADAVFDEIDRGYKMREGVDLMLCGYFYYREDLRGNPESFSNIKDPYDVFRRAEMVAGRDFNCAAIVPHRTK